MHDPVVVLQKREKDKTHTAHKQQQQSTVYSYLAKEVKIYLKDYGTTWEPRTSRRMSCLDSQPMNSTKKQMMMMTAEKRLFIKCCAASILILQQSTTTQLNGMD